MRKVPSKGFCAQHTLPDFRIHLINFRGEFVAKKRNVLDLLAALNVCREPSLRHNRVSQKMMIGGTLPGEENPTLEEYIKAQLKLQESRWENWNNNEFGSQAGISSTSWRLSTTRLCFSFAKKSSKVSGRLNKAETPASGILSWNISSLCRWILSSSS